MKKNQKPVLPTLGAIIVFPARMWEPHTKCLPDESTMTFWTSRPVTEAERKDRKLLADNLRSRMEVSE